MRRQQVQRLTRDRRFWTALDHLLASTGIIVDRPKGSSHPKYPEIVYPVDYGYLRDTRSQDGTGIDIWIGSKKGKAGDAVVCVIDLLKRDSEIKILYGCTAAETRSIYRFHNTNHMKATVITR